MTDRAFRDLLNEHASLEEKSKHLRAELYSVRVDLAKARDVNTNKDKQIRTLAANSTRSQESKCRHQHELAEYARNE